jgi:hypothetical protein
MDEESYNGWGMIVFAGAPSAAKLTSSAAAATAAGTSLPKRRRVVSPAVCVDASVVLAELDRADANEATAAQQRALDAIAATWRNPRFAFLHITTLLSCLRTHTLCHLHTRPLEAFRPCHDGVTFAC